MAKTKRTDAAAYRSYVHEKTYRQACRNTGEKRRRKNELQWQDKTQELLNKWTRS